MILSGNHAPERSPPRLEFRGLGTVEVWCAGQRLAIGGRKQRGLLALLMLEPGQVVSTARMTDRLWPDGRGSRDTLYRLASRLRSALSVVDEDVLVARSGGYVLAVDPRQVDLSQFERLRNRGRAELDAGRFAAASDLLAESLALWRGAALTGVAESIRQGPAARLQELRLLAVEERATADMQLGRHEQLVPELRELVADHPGRQRLVAQLMTALHGCGRRVEALDVYNTTRQYMVDELGLEPGDLLQHTQQRILADEPATRSEVAAPAEGVADGLVPRQLPADIDAFTGRDTTLSALNDLLGELDHRAEGPVVVTAIGGIAGIGKTALAVHWAHQIAGRFPDGQLYVNLRGFASRGQPMEPAEALRNFLDALGVSPQRMPRSLDAQVGLYRSLLARTQTLVVLDNARDADQVRPLLPGSPGCLVIVTSRNQLASLVAVDGAHPITLDVLSVAESRQLLIGRLGHDRVAAEPEAADEVVRRCGYLPLALRIAGARLAARPTWPIGALAERLGDAQRRLDELTADEVGVRASFTVSHQQLATSDDPADRAAAAAFGIVGMLDGPDLDAQVAARLLHVAEDDAEEVLERLVDAQLLGTSSPSRYQLHDLLNLYARELAFECHDEAARAAALARAFGFYLSTAWHTLELLCPGDHRLTRADDRWRTGGRNFGGAQAALEWLETQRANLLAAIRQAADTPGVPAAMAVQLAQALAGFFSVRSYWDDWIEVNRIALEVACAAGDRTAQAQAHNDLGVAYWRQGRFDQAQIRHEQSLAICREVGDRYGEGVSLTSLGRVYRAQGRFDQAQVYYEQSLVICREVGDRRDEGESLGALGYLYQHHGRTVDALTSLHQSLAIRRELGDRHGQAISLNTLGLILQLQDRYDEALTSHEQSLAIRRELGDRHGEASTMADLGVVYARQGQLDRALAIQRASLTVFRELVDPHCEAECLRQLGETLHALGLTAEARSHWRDALAIFERLQTTDVGQVRALLKGTASTPS